MLNPNLLLLEHTLKSSFSVVFIVVNKYGEEHEVSFKKKYKDFMRENYLGLIRVCLVDDYPPSVMEKNIYYVKKNGKTVWLKLDEKDLDNFGEIGNTKRS